MAPLAANFNSLEDGKSNNDLTGLCEVGGASVQVVVPLYSEDESSGNGAEISEGSDRKIPVYAYSYPLHGFNEVTKKINAAGNFDTHCDIRLRNTNAEFVPILMR